MAAEVLSCAPVDGQPAHQLRQLVFHAGQRQQTRLGGGVEFHEQVDIAVRPFVAMQARTEKRQTPDPVAAAKIGADRFVDWNLVIGVSRLGGCDGRDWVSLG